MSLKPWEFIVNSQPHTCPRPPAIFFCHFLLFCEHLFEPPDSSKLSHSGPVCMWKEAQMERHSILKWIGNYVKSSHTFPSVTFFSRIRFGKIIQTWQYCRGAEKEMHSCQMLRSNTDIVNYCPFFPVIEFMQ